MKANAERGGLGTRDGIDLNLSSTHQSSANFSLMGHAMRRFFLLLSALSITMIIGVGGGIWWLTMEQTQKSYQQVSAALAKSTAMSIASKIEQFYEILDRFGQDPELIAAVVNDNPEQLKTVLNRLQMLLPEAMKLRFLLPETNLLDNSQIPHMGYADIELVRQSFQRNQPAKIQGESGPNRHLAIARKIEINDRITGVLLASMHYDFLKQTVDAAPPKQGLVALKQDRLIMASNSILEPARPAEFAPIRITGTDWVIEYWTTQRDAALDSSWLFTFIIIPCLILLLVFWLTFRKASTLLRNDQVSILHAVKDMTEGRPSGHYPIFFEDLKIIIASIMQYRRLMNPGALPMETRSHEDELNLDDLFDEFPEDPNLEITHHTTERQPPSNSTADTANSLFPRGEPAFLPALPSEALPSDDNLFDNLKIELDNSTDFSSLFRAHDIRGVVGKTLTKERVYDIGRAFASEAIAKSCKTAIVARDGRNSGPALSEQLIRGILSTGLNVVDLGRVPTPVLYFAAHRHEDHTGVMLTGSHNPAHYNGMKMVLAGTVLAEEAIQTLRQRIANNNFVTSEPAGQLSADAEPVREYITRISEDVHLTRSMKVIVDCGNGVTGEIAPKLLKTLGCDVIELYCDIDGDFPNHHPDPSQPENLKDLSVAVKHYQADLGIAFDGDGDRLGVVDSQGKIIWPDRQMMLFAENVLRVNPGAEIIFDVKCSSHLARVISNLGGKPIMYKTGHSLIKAKLKACGAKLAGEMSGHIFFNDRWFGFDDALYSAARLLEILSTDNRNSCAVFADFPDSVNTPEINIELHEGENAALVEQFIGAAKFPDATICTLDGLRADFAEGWGLIRASNTKPSLVLRFEADSPPALAKIQQQFKNLLLQIKPDLPLPF